MSGYWSGRKRPDYKRRAVERDVTGFVGWEKLVELPTKFTGALIRRNQALYATAFLTGGRIGEVLLLRTDNFDIGEEEVVVKRMRLFKRYEKVGEWLEWVKEKPQTRLARLFKLNEGRGQYYRKRYETEKKEEYRSDFSFPADEPLAQVLVNWVEHLNDYLFSGYRQKQLSYIRAYQILTSINIYPHWLRAQRASCLISFYGMKMEEMMEWMGWQELTTARMYAKFGIKRLTSKMQGRKYPQKTLEIMEKM